MMNIPQCFIPCDNFLSSHGHDRCCFLSCVRGLRLPTSTRPRPAGTTDVLHPTETVAAWQQHPVTMQLQTVSCAGLERER